MKNAGHGNLTTYDIYVVQTDTAYITYCNIVSFIKMISWKSERGLASPPKRISAFVQIVNVTLNLPKCNLQRR